MDLRKLQKDKYGEPLDSANEIGAWYQAHLIIPADNNTPYIWNYEK